LTTNDLRPKGSQPRKSEFTPTYPKAEPQKLKFVAAYDFFDADGVLLFQKVRFIDENTGRKTFRQRKPDGKGGWTYKLEDTPKILYNLPAVLHAKNNGDSIFVVEGEKDADTINALGGVATTMPGGAGKWLPIHTNALAGATVDIIADNDEPGIKHALTVYEQLREAGCDVAVFVCPTEKDITDHIQAGGSIDQLVQFDVASADKEALSEIREQLADEEFEDDDVAPMSPAEETLAKLRNLLEQDKSPTFLLNKAGLILKTSGQDGPELDTGRLVDWGEFVDEQVDDSYDWLIPGLLERRERVIVVAAEGVGKTMLARQVAICSSLGVHPFTFQRMPRIRTLTVDLENPERIIRRSSTSIVGAARSMGFEKKMDAHLLIKPDGLNLLNASDRLILEDHIEQVKPDMVVMGPLYKSFIDPGTKTSEAIAIEVAKYLDTIRQVYGVALWLEHHAPLGQSMSTRDLRPFGSAVWSRWPEFGLALQPDPSHVGEYVYNVGHFRGARDVRDFPVKIKRGKKFPFEVLEWPKV
jgi:5S rRNA maturation endonuclease (ribonuclease M5)